MSDNPYLEASKYHTACRRELKRHLEAEARELNNHEARMLELRQALSPAAARIVVAAESLEKEFAGPQQLEDPDPGYPPQDWLNATPPPLAPGALLEVAEKPARRRA